MGALSSSTKQSQAATGEVVKPSIAAEHSEAVPTKDKLGRGGVFAGSPLFGPSSHEKEETELKTITRERPQSTTIAEPAAPSAWGKSASASIDTVAASIENRGPNQGAPDHTASRLFNQGDNLSREVSLRTNVESSDYDPFYTPPIKAEGCRRPWSSTGS